MSKKRILLSSLIVASLFLITPDAARANEARMPRTAALLEMRLGGAATIAVNGTALTAVPSLLVGVRLVDRLQLGLGFSFFRFFNDGTNTANNAVNFVPTLSVDAFQSADRAFALYVKMGLPIGVVINCNGNNCTNDLGVGFDVALGGRYLFHRHFAMGLEAGVAGTFVGVQRGNNDHLISFYGALVGTVYF